jgi:hypothetical protein
VNLVNKVTSSRKPLNDFKIRFPEGIVAFSVIDLGSMLILVLV